MQNDTVARLTALLAIEERAERAALSVNPKGNKYSRAAAARAEQIRAQIATLSADDASERCVECGGLVDAGDEPGHGFYDNGAEAPLCSEACTEKFYA